MESVSWFKHAKQFKHCYKHVRKGQLVEICIKLLQQSSLLVLLI
uniref:Bm13098 n=1 Tax=Brugia malayi TaxID=6279 RepID=A0A1I9G295_BRUMA|nr:Bm13098 [Brugia malayi]